MGEFSIYDPSTWISYIVNLGIAITIFSWFVIPPIQRMVNTFRKGVNDRKE